MRSAYCEWCVCGVEGLEGPPPWSLYPRISIFKMAGDLSPAGARPRAPRRDGPATSFGQRVELPARHCVPGRGLSAGGRGLTKIRESRGWADAYRLRALEFIDWGRGPANGRVNTTLTESISPLACCTHYSPTNAAATDQENASGKLTNLREIFADFRWTVWRSVRRSLLLLLLSYKVVNLVFISSKLATLSSPTGIDGLWLCFCCDYYYYVVLSPPLPLQLKGQ